MKQISMTSKLLVIIFLLAPCTFYSLLAQDTKTNNSDPEHNKKPTADWYKQPTCGIGINIWAPGWYDKSITDFAPEELAELVKEAHAEVGLTFQGFCQDHFGNSFFPTKLGPQHPNLDGRDFMGSYLEAMHSQGLKVFGYYSYFDKHMWEQHPDWRLKDIKGGDISPMTTLEELCPNSPYQDHVIERIAEIVTLYNLDGLLLDAGGFRANKVSAGCYCEHCRKKYKKEFGKSLPEGKADHSPEYQQFIQWHYTCTRDFFIRLHDRVKAIRPEMVFSFNCYVFNDARWVSGVTVDNLDGYYEVLSALAIWEKQSRNTGCIWQAGFLARTLRGFTDGPVWVQTAAHSYFRQNSFSPAADMGLAVMSIVANGGSPFFIASTNPDGSPHHVGFKNMGEVMEQVGHFKPYLNYDDEIKYAAVIYSRASRDWTDIDKPGAEHYMTNLKSTGKILMEAKIPYQIISDQRVNPEILQQYRVIILPENAVITQVQLVMYRNYVNNGGGLIAMGRTSLADENGQQGKDFALSDLFGVSYQGETKDDQNFMMLKNHEMCPEMAETYKEDAIYFRIPVVTASPSGKGQTVATLARPQRMMDEKYFFTYTLDDNYPDTETDFAAIRATEPGKGRCVYFAGNIAEAYGLNGSEENYRLFESAVTWCGREQVPIIVDAPASVEAHCFVNGDTYQVRLANHTTSTLHVHANRKGVQARENVAVGPIKINLAIGNKKVQSVYLASNNEKLPFEISNNTIITELPRLGLFEIVIIDCEK